VEQAVAFRTEMRARAAANGRNPDHLLIVPGYGVIIADTDAEARDREDAIAGGKSFERALAELGRPFGWHDFSQYDLDAPFPEVGSAGERSFRTQAERITKLARDNHLTLRQVVELQLRGHRSPFVGSPQTVADEIQRWFDAGAFDGINIHVTVPSEFARFTDEVLPILRERGVVRSDYESTTLRGNLGLPVPENRYTAQREQTAVPASV
jgi:alkanesulfonate monooxygenase SsuD/methylene tetrahydromethanopterin reductase-like flavin-dependent oxidoreductase (luciferase family)